MSTTFSQAIANFSPQLPLGIAFSGGADSTALLVATAQKWPGQVIALHINHGLQTAAMDFQRHCEGVCTELAVPLRVARVSAGAAPGQSPEDAARIARYKELVALGLAEDAQSAIKSIATAQHADDQVETLLLALGRGAGLAGLSGMAPQWRRGGLDFHRPLLDVPAHAIREWLAVQGQNFIEDPSNANVRFTRNHIRARLLPALAEVFPQFRDTFTRSSAHAAQAQALINEFGQVDLEAVSALNSQQPVIAKLQQLSRPRLANVLRHWLKAQYNVIPNAAQLDELLAQITACTTRGHQIHIKVGAGFVKREGLVLAWYNP